MRLRIVPVELPNSIRGAITPLEEEGGYLIAYNSELDRQGRIYAIAHELRHIIYDHLNSAAPLREKEQEAEAIIRD